MNTETHPLLSYLRSKKTKETLTSFALRVGLSRAHLYRIMSGENTTVDVLMSISGATGGKVPVSAFIKPMKERAEAQDTSKVEDAA